jgi:molybdenum cofactor cytidylyltransferase
MNMSRFAAVILAGGLSTRMEQLKPLLPLGKATITDAAVATFLGLGVDVYLVVGYRREQIEAGINNNGITIVYNPDFKKGMLTSIQAGVRRLKPGYQAFFVLPVDIPLVKPASIKQLIEAGTANPEKIIYPTYNSKRGHPPLIPASLIPEILGWDKEGGLKTFLKMYEKSAFEVPVNDEFILLDIDTPEDYKNLLVRYRQET